MSGAMVTTSKMGGGGGGGGGSGSPDSVEPGAKRRRPNNQLRQDAASVILELCAKGGLDKSHPVFDSMQSMTAMAGLLEGVIEQEREKSALPSPVPRGQGGGMSSVSSSVPPSSSPAAQSAQDAFATRSWYTPTPQEATWARALRTATEKAGMSFNSDFDLCQMAIACKGNSASGVKRLQALRGLNQDLRLDEINLMEAITWVDTSLPRVVEAGYRDIKGRLTVCTFADRFIDSKLSENNGFGVRRWMKFVLGALDAGTCDLDEGRRGVLNVALCSGAGWPNMPRSILKPLGVVYESYPVDVHHLIVDSSLFMWSVLQAYDTILRKLWGRAHSLIKMVTSGAQLDAELPPECRPGCVGGGSYEVPLLTWFEEKLTRRAEAVAKCVLPQ